MGNESVDPRLKDDADLEAAVKNLQDRELHPLVSRITHKFGAFNLIRNARNKKQVDIEEINKLERG